MFSFFKRSKKDQKSKQKHDASASKVAVPSTIVPNALETQPTSPVANAMRFLDQDDGAVNRVDAKVRTTAEHSGSGGEGENVKNKQYPPLTASCFSPNDIIHENGRSFNFEDGTGSVIEFADAAVTDDEDVINECEKREDFKLLPLLIRGETNVPKSEQSTSYNQSANPFESAMAKGKNKRRYQQQQNGKNLQQQQGQKQQQSQHPNKDNHLQKTHADGKCEKPNKINVEKVNATVVTTAKVTQLAENVTQVLEINGEVNRSEHNSNEEQKVKIVSKDSASEQRPCLTADDVNGHNVEVREDKNSLAVRSDTNKPSHEDGPYNLSRCPDDGFGVSAEDSSTVTSSSVTSRFPLTQTSSNDLSALVAGRDAGVHELLKSINNDSVSSQSPATELHSSAISISDEIKDGLLETSRSSDTVTSKDVTSDTEMGQPPSKLSEPASNNRRSLTPSRQLPSANSESPQRLSPAVQVKQDASRDDISDDRDVFYEATESLSPVSNPSTLDKSDPSVPVAAGVKQAEQEKTPPPKAIISAHPNEARVSPKKRVVFSDLLIIDGNPPREPDSRNGSVSSASTKSLPNALNLEPPSYEHVAENHEESVHVESSPSDSLVFNNSSNEVLSVVKSVEQSAFISDRSGICPSVPMLMSKPNLIEFRYDHSEPSAPENDHQEEEKVKSQPTSINGDKEIENGTEIISLPDVVQPTGIEKATKQPFTTVDKINSEMKELVNQESRYSAKLEDAEKRASEAQTKVYELQLRLEEVERDVSMKESSVDRLKGELEAACKECESIRARLLSQNSEMDALRLKFSEREDELNLKYQNLEIEYLELNEKLKDVRQLAHELNMQLIDAQTVAETVRKEKDKLLEERAEEQKIIKEALELALKERAQVEAKWKNDFEQLRTVNTDREEHLMEDCEWKIRSMQKNCKEKIEAAERERKLTMDKMARLEQESRKNAEEVQHLRSFEAEVSQLRGLTYEQKESLMVMTRQIDQLKAELEMANNKLEVEIVKVQQIKNRCEYQLCDKEREALNRIEIARGEIAMQWEDRLLHEMNRLKVELEQMHMEERISAINKIKREALEETEALKNKFNMRERQLKEEIQSLKATIERQKQAMEQAQTEADYKMVQSRMFVERAEREHETILEREVSKRDQIIENLKEQYEKEKYDMEQHFSLRIQQVQEEFQRELSDTTEMLKASHKKDLEQQWKSLVSEKEEALQLMESRHRNRLEEAENKIRELTVSHQRQLKDLQEDHRYEISSLETRDSKNAQEIQTLHKKCRCLTNLFEEMRMRYERRDPRPEDLQQIEELKSVIESQDRDLRLLTEQFREMQLHERELQQRLFQQQQQHPPQPPRRAKNRGKQQPNQQIDSAPVEDQPQQQQSPQPPQIQIQPMTTPVPIVCDVIYEENEADLINEETHEQFEQIAAQLDQTETSHSEQDSIVDVPESQIETITSNVHSTEPVIIDSLPTSPTEQNFSEVIDSSQNCEETQQETPVIQIDQLPEMQNVTIPVLTPSIVITEESGELVEPDSTEVCITTVIELPAPVPCKPVAIQSIVESASDSEFDEVQQKVQSMPEMIVIREPDVVAEAKAAAAATFDISSSVDVVVCSPGPRSSST